MGIMQPKNNYRPEDRRASYRPRPVSIDGVYERRYTRPTQPSHSRYAAIKSRHTEVDPKSTLSSQPTFTNPSISGQTAGNYDQTHSLKNQLDFTPPPKKKTKLRIKKPRIFSKKLFKFLGLLIVGIIVLVSLVLAFRWYANQNSPQKLFLEAYYNSLQTTNFKAYTKNGETDSRVGFDLMNPKNPIIFSNQTISSSGAIFNVEGYGNSKTSYIKYVKLPKSIQSPLSTAALNAQVMVRSNGVLPANVPTTIAEANDPRYRLVGPVVFGNLDKKTAEQMINYIKNNNVYTIDNKKTERADLDGNKVTVIEAKMNIGQVKLLNQSMAGTMGFTAADVEGAINNLDNFKGDNLKIFIGKDKRILRTELINNSSSLITSYSDFNQIATPLEPQTKVQWQNFADVHYQMQAIAAGSQPIKSIDNTRKNKLQSINKQFKKYYLQTGSYPTLENLNNPMWVSANLSGFDPDLLRDPLSPSVSLKGAPAVSIFAYTTTPELKTSNCSNNPENPCAHYNLIATLADGKLQTVTDLDNYDK